MKPGARAGNLTVLSENELDRIYQASLDLLMDPGVLSESDLFLEIFEKGGAKVNREARSIHVPRDMVEWAIDQVPKSFILYGRNDPAMDLQIELGRVYYGMGGTSEPMFWDYEARRPRQPTKQDMINNTRIGHALENIDFVQTLCMSGDMPTSTVFFHDFDAILRNTTKPTVINILERPFTQKLLAMVAAASGGESVMREKPSALGIVTPVTPLKIAVMNEGLVDAVHAGIPILYSPGPLMGATGPATVAGTVALTNAEVLFGVVLTQLVQPGAKVVLKPDTDVFDMRTTQVTYGSPEQDLGKIAMVQLAKRYGIPIYGLGGGVEAKLPDAEAAAEATQTLLLVSLAGMTMCQANGTLCFGQYGSPEMAMICDEIIRHIKRILQGFEVTEETLAINVIRQVGPGGSFLGHPHTARHFRKELFFPVLFKRQTIDEWLSAGAKSIDQVAHEKVLEILAQAKPVELPPGADEALERALQEAIRET
ncbi:MAG: trimethylamine methyltransferase family protein [Anaerolineales bacterium]|nr:trimethylamine methyltransferase family protein [Anaerolineales bacterium]MDW8162640.1 trimethylamine methyltransferase family protein [Anaerolineales bacterium]